MNTRNKKSRKIREDRRWGASGDCLAGRHRRLTFEPLESRELLSVSALGTPFLASSQTSSSHINAAVATNTAGESVVVWQSQNQASSDSLNDIYAIRCDADGNAVGTEFLVNTYTTDEQTVPVVAMADDGSFVVVWQSTGPTDPRYVIDLSEERTGAAVQCRRDSRRFRVPGLHLQGPQPGASNRHGR